MRQIFQAPEVLCKVALPFKAIRGYESKAEVSPSALIAVKGSESKGKGQFYTALQATKKTFVLCPPPRWLTVVQAVACKGPHR